VRHRSTAAITLVWLVVAFAAAASVRACVDNARVETAITSLLLFPFPLITRAIIVAVDFALPAHGSESAFASLSPFVHGMLVVLALAIYAGVVALLVASARRGLQLVKQRRMLRRKIG